MTPDKNNFQFRNDGSREAIEAIDMLGLPNERWYQYYGLYNGVSDAWFHQEMDVPLITPSEALALLCDTPATTTMLQELEGLKKPKDAWCEDHNEAIDDAIEIVTKHTAPQPNMEEVEKLVQIAADKYALDAIVRRRKAANSYDIVSIQSTALTRDEYASSLRTRIGYTLDANGKAVAIQKGGEDGK